jgi:hypothetical protein
MENTKSASRKVAWIIICFMLLASAALGTAVYLGITRLVQFLRPDVLANPNLSSLNHLWQLISLAETKFWYILFPGILAVGLIIALLTWLIIRPSIKRSAEAAPSRVKTPKKGDDLADAEERKLSDRRLFLHLFSLMQREGRLMDFLAEDLDIYEDAQIGSAVRSIHANCRKLVQEYLKPKPVMDQAEGDEVGVPADFDPGLIKLTGNVVGKPPFKGLLRHRGWRVGKMVVPSLSGSQNAEIIAPAEVEIT